MNMAITDPFDLKRMTFGALLRNFRVRRMLSARELAKLAGISRSYVTMLESGKRTPRFGSLRGLCHALKLEGEELGMFCDAALRNAPPHMLDRPSGALSLDSVLGPATDENQRGFNNVRLPPMGEEEKEFMRKVAGQAHGGSASVTDGHGCSPRFTEPSKPRRPTPSHAGREKWTAPVTHRSRSR